MAALREVGVQEHRQRICKSLFKHRFYYYSGIVRPTAQEMIALEKMVCYSQIPRGRGTPCHAGPQGRTRVRQEAEGARGKCTQERLLWLL